MNLTQNPTREQLAALLASVDDDADTHVIAVMLTGEVRIVPWSRFDKSDRSMRFRFESYGRGNGYAGPAAAADAIRVARLFDELVGHWANGERGFIDYPPA